MILVGEIGADIDLFVEVAEVRLNVFVNCQYSFALLCEMIDFAPCLLQLL